QILDAPFLNFNTGNELLDTAMFDMFLSLLSYIAQNERVKIKERQRQGVLLAKQAGRYKGRPTEYAPNSKNPQKRLVYQKVVK
ncbi:recombinase family protein, partial [Guyparkeria sp. 1SP6A2]|nr:recombinase family protein [Guyparkeria sp. 1SP6A2]